MKSPLAETRPSQLLVYPDREALITAATDRLAGLLRDLAPRQAAIALALAGGSTPAPIYAALGEQADLPWAQLQLFWGDERWVAPDHPDSNYGMVRRTLLAKAPIPPAHIQPMPTDLPSPEEAAAVYEQTLRHCCGEPPVLDLVLLGMGDDGHTASLFPHTTALNAPGWVTVGDRQGQPRLSFTAATINAARRVWFLISGADKAEALAAVLAPEGDGDRYPSRRIHPAGELCFMVDAAAAADLPPDWLNP